MLDEFDRNAGKVKRHVVTGESGVGLSFHEDRFGVFWIVYGPDGSIATFDPKPNKLTCYGFDSRGPESNLKNAPTPCWRTTKATCGLGCGPLLPDSVIRQ
jgi:hypothetical protein